MGQNPICVMTTLQWFSKSKMSNIWSKLIEHQSHHKQNKNTFSVYQFVCHFIDYSKEFIFAIRYFKKRVNNENIVKYPNQSNNPPIPASSYSSFGGGGTSFLAFLSSFFGYYLGACLAAGAGSEAADDDPEAPKLKNEAMFCPSTALAKSFGQYDSTLIPAALTKVAIFSPITIIIWHTSDVLSIVVEDEGSISAS